MLLNTNLKIGLGLLETRPTNIQKNKIYTSQNKVSPCLCGLRIFSARPLIIYASELSSTSKLLLSSVPKENIHFPANSPRIDDRLFFPLEVPQFW